MTLSTRSAHPTVFLVDPDAALLEALTSPTLPIKKHSFRRRDAELDPLLLAAAMASGPGVTRNHYTHDFLSRLSHFRKLRVPGTGQSGMVSASVAVDHPKENSSTLADKGLENSRGAAGGKGRTILTLHGH